MSKLNRDQISNSAVYDAYTSPKNLLVYYGWLNCFNPSINNYNNEKVAQDMAKYDIIILGEGLQNPTHTDYANTQVVLPRVKALNPTVLIFGYVNTLYTLADFQTATDQWDALQVNGIYMDEAGYNCGTTRSDFNTRIDYVRLRTYSNICFVNSWNIDHIIGTADDAEYPNSTWNPSLVESKLIEKDWYLLSSFSVDTVSFSGNNGYEDKEEWYIRGSKAIERRATYGINLASVGIIGNNSAKGQELFNFLSLSSIMFSLDACGSTDTNYGASSSTVYSWHRPNTVELGKLWSPNLEVSVDILDNDIYYRYTDHSKLVLDFSTGAQLSEIIYENGLGVGLYYKRHRGTSPYESWITAPTTGTALTTGAVASNRLYAIPIPISEITRFDRIAINVTTAGSGNIRLGIYEDINAYPGKLLLDAGTVSTSSTGVKSIAISHLVSPGRKWLVLVSSGTPTLRSFAVASLVNSLGYGSALGTAAIQGFYVSYTYATLPLVFPGNPTLITAVPIPAVFLRIA